MLFRSGLGMALYFASQGAGAMTWPLFAGLVRMAIAVAGGWLLLQTGAGLTWVFAVLGLALAVFGTTIAGAVAAGAWFRGRNDSGAGSG